MSTITAQIIAEIRALGWRCLVFGPEAWLAITAMAVVCALACIVIFPFSAFGREEGKQLEPVAPALDRAAEPDRRDVFDGASCLGAERRLLEGRYRTAGKEENNE